jgi:hypothetical protein
LREPLGSTADKTMQRERSGQLSYGAIHIQTFRRGDNGLVGYQAALSSMMRSAARLAGFFVLSHVFDGLERTMASQEIEPKLGAESFSCPHCNALAHNDWFSLFLKPENATEVVVLTLEAAMLAKSEEGDELIERLKDNVLTYEYQESPRTLKVKLVNLHVSRCYSCKGFAIWVRDRLVFPIRRKKTGIHNGRGLQGSH